MLAGRGADEVGGPRRINAVLAGVRGFLAFAVDLGEARQEVMRQLYELADSRSPPAQARGEDGASRMRARHHVQVSKTRTSRPSDEQAVALLRGCPSARDRPLVLVRCRAPYGWVVGDHKPYYPTTSLVTGQTLVVNGGVLLGRGAR